MHPDSTDALRGHVSALGSTSMVVAAYSATWAPVAHTRPPGAHSEAPDSHRARRRGS